MGIPKFPRGYHIICERDVGLFSLIQQVVAQIPWALQENRIPIAFLGERCTYWNPEGYAGADNVWEYYFEPVLKDYPAAIIDPKTAVRIRADFPQHLKIGRFIDEVHWVSNNFGDNIRLIGKTIRIPYEWADPSVRVRKRTAEVIEHYVRPRNYLQEKVGEFASAHFRGHFIIGVHARGTDSIGDGEQRAFRRGSLVLERYLKKIQRILNGQPEARIFVATDDQRTLDWFIGCFGDRVIAWDSLRHEAGPASGQGPTGWLMPAYISNDPAQAARNGEEAIIEYSLLRKSNLLVHNGASLARTVLLAQPELVHFNTHLMMKWQVARSILTQRYLKNIFRQFHNQWIG